MAIDRESVDRILQDIDEALRAAPPAPWPIRPEPVAARAFIPGVRVVAAATFTGVGTLTATGSATLPDVSTLTRAQELILAVFVAAGDRAATLAFENLLAAVTTAVGVNWHEIYEFAEFAYISIPK